MALRPMTIVFVALGCFSVVFSEDDAVVHTTTGILYGKKTTTLQKPLVQYLGVPYAKPPVNILRFQPPQELRSETEIRNAANYAPSCYQPLHLKSVISPLLKPNVADISEDCLYLNIFVPEIKSQSEKPLPVIVWLPGEGFDFADPQQFDGSYLAVLGKVIVVTVNYRLSVFGFLSTLTPHAPGNVGLLDQRMALQWLKKNVAKFGGDSENITLFGRFTGSMSVAIQTFSPKNRNEKLFQRAIMQSGVPIADWVYDKNPQNATLKLAELTNCLLPSITETMSCLKKLPSDILLEKAMNIPQRFRPVFDGQLIKEEVLKTAEKISSNPIDILLGINNDEGSLCATILKAMHSPFYQKLLKQKLTILDFQNLIDTNLLDIYKKRDFLLNKLTAHEYTSTVEEKSKLRESLVNFCGDVYITSHVQKLADLTADKGRVYMYEFAHRPSFSIHPPFVRAGHGDDVLFALGLPFQLSDLPHDEVTLTRKMVEAIANFARKGNPNHEDATDMSWPQYTSSKQEIMTFTSSRKDEGKEVVRKSSHAGAVAFWHDVIPAMQERSCPVSEGQQNFTHSKSTEQGHPSQVRSTTQGPLIGGVLTLREAEYLLMGLFCSAVFLFMTSMTTIVLLWRNKKCYAFERMK